MQIFQKLDIPWYFVSPWALSFLVQYGRHGQEEITEFPFLPLE